MRKLVLVVWLMIPVVAWAYHYGPGQDQMLLDEASTLIGRAESHAAAEEYEQAAAAYEEVLTLLPGAMVGTAQRVRLERAKAQMLAKQLPEARADLQSLLTDLTADQQADPKLTEEVRSTLANSQYYMTWLMRLEGRSREEWEPEIEAARQNYRLLAEKSQDRGDSESLKQRQEDLESTIRLARLDLKDLQGLPLPSQ
jgi:tetratricopeptide (TPR) repeat protein